MSAFSNKNKYKHLTANAFGNVIKEKQPKILVFGAKWSGNTVIIDSIMERVSQQFSPEIQFFKVDIEVHKDVTNFFGVYSIPTIIMLKDGEVANSVKGFLPARKMSEIIKNTYLPL